MTAPTLSATLAVARSLLGIREVPPGSDLTPIGAEYGWNGVAWCDMTVSLIGKRASGTWDWLGRFAYTVAHAQWFERAGHWHAFSEAPRPGDVVFFDWQIPYDRTARSIGKIDHVGIVEAVQSDGNIVVINGNYNQRVERTVFNPRTCVVGYGRPTYATPAQPVASKTPTVSVTTLRVAAQHDPARPQGGTTTGATTAVRIIEDALRKEGLLDARYAGDGSYGSKTISAYAAWQRRCGYTGRDADGIPGPTSLSRLGARHGFRTKA